MAEKEEADPEEKEKRGGDAPREKKGKRAPRKRRRANPLRVDQAEAKAGGESAA